MLQSMHDRAQSWISWLIVATVSVLFALWGISYYLSPSQEDASLKAVVNGKKISTQWYRRSLENTLQASGLDQLTDDLRATVLEQLVRKILLLELAEESEFITSDAQIEESIAQIPLFQEGGQFSQMQFDRVLPRLGLTVSQLKQEMKDNVNSLQLNQGIQATAFVLSHTLQHDIRLALQTRDFRYAFIPFESFISEPITTEQAQYYFTQHSKDWISEDQIEIEYVILDRQQMMNQNMTTEVANKAFQEQGERLAELAFENPGSLQPIEQTLNLVVQSSGKLYKQASKNQDFFQNQEMLNTVFSEAVLGGDNSGLISLSDSSVMVLRQKKFYPSHILSFKEAEEQVKMQLEHLSQKNQAKWWAAELIAQKKEGKQSDAESALKQKNIAWTVASLTHQAGQDLPLGVRRKVLDLSQSDLGLWTEFADARGLFLIELQKIEDPSSEMMQKEELQFSAGLSMLKSQVFLLDILKQRRDHANIQVHF